MAEQSTPYVAEGHHLLSHASWHSHGDVRRYEWACACGVTCEDTDDDRAALAWAKHVRAVGDEALDAPASAASTAGEDEA